MFNTLTIDRGQNLFQTTTHTGHHWRDGYYFPSTNFQTTLYDPIPQELNCKDETLPQIHYQTTKNVYFDNKYPLQDLYNDPVSLRHMKPIPHYRVNYISDVVEKLNAKPRRPLTMAFQKSEYKGEFDNADPEVMYEFDRPLRAAQAYLLNDEIFNGATKSAFDDTVKPIVPIKKFDPNKEGVLNLLDPYMTTYNKDIKKWSPEVLNGISKKDAITIYDTNEIPKTNNGFGTKLNPIPFGDNGSANLPMKDDIWFPSKVKHRKVHQPFKPVPHSGLVTEIRENYKNPSDIKAKEAKLCPIEPPSNIPLPGSKSAYAAPNMYRTEYNNIGLGKTITTSNMKDKNF